MKNLKYFKVLGQYFKDDKIKLAIYIFLTCFIAFQSLLYPYLWSQAIAALVHKEWLTFFDILNSLGWNSNYL